MATILAFDPNRPKAAAAPTSLNQYAQTFSALSASSKKYALQYAEDLLKMECGGKLEDRA